MATICIVTLNFTDRPLAETLAVAREAGFNAFETWQMDTAHQGDLRLSASETDGTPEPEEVQRCLDRILAASEAAGVRPAVIGGFNDFVQAEEDAFRREVAKVRAYIELAAGTGCRLVRVMGGEPKTNLGVDGWVPRIVQGFQACMPLAEGAGVTLALENHGYITNHAPTTLRILQEVGSDHLKCNMDASNYRWAGYPVETVYAFYRQIAPHTAYAHLKNGDGRTGATRDYTATRLDQGEMDLDRFVGALAESGFDGVWGIEYEGPDDPADAMKRNHQHAVTLLEKHGYTVD